MENDGGEKLEGLEIVSIGALYSGPWDKKYWSSSRGKDRYPYPIGYHALRTNAGVTYKMEIREGMKGPLFVVTATSGDSSSGQTPDIAWEYFQKSGPRVKNCLGKRFSCKVDGIELFGFRNPFVQRLLRELVANVHGVAEQCLISSNHHNGCSLLMHDTREPESSMHTDLLMYLGKQHGTGKRSRKHRNAVRKEATAACINRFQSQDSMHNVNLRTSKQGNGLSVEMVPLKDKITHGEALSHGPINLKDAKILKISCDVPYPTGSVQDSVQHEPLDEKLAAIERDCNSVSYIDDVPVKSRKSDCFVGENSRLVGHEDSDPMDLKNKLPTMDNEMLDGSLDSDLERVKSLVKAQASGLENSIGDTDRKDLDLYIPDSLDIAQDNVNDTVLSNGGGSLLCDTDEFVADKPIPGVATSCAYELSTHDVPNELIRRSEAHTDILDPRSSAREMEPPVNECLLDDVSSSGFVKESQSADLDRCTVSMNTHKSPIEFAGQDLARSMMTLLLPRAVPLLTKTYKRKRVQKHSQETSFLSNIDLNGPNFIPRSDLVCRLNNLPFQGEQVELPLKGTEQQIKKRETPVQTSSLFQENKDECTCNCVINEPITTPGKSEGVQSIIPDSLEDDQSATAHDPVLPRPLCSSGEAIQAPSESRNNDPEAVQSLGNDKSDQEKTDSKFGGDEGNNLSLLPDSSPHKGEFLCNSSLSACLSPGKCIIPGKSENACLNTDEKSLHIAGSFHADAIEDIPAMETYGILDKDSHPLDIEVIHGFEESFHRRQQYVSSTQCRKTGHPTEVNPNIKTIFRKIHEKTAKVRCAASALNVSLDDEKVITANVLPSIAEPHDGYGMTGKLPCSLRSRSKYKVPFSESIICRNTNNGEVLKNYSDKPLHIIMNRHVEVDNSNINENAAFYDGKQCLKTSINISDSVDVLFNVAPPACHSQELVKHVSSETNGFKSLHTCISAVENNHVNPVNNLAAAEECCDHVPLFQELTKYSLDQSHNGALVYSDENPLVKSIASNDCVHHPHTEVYKGNSLSKDMNPNEELDGFVELIGCYLHPNPILSILLRVKEGALHVCVLCGPSEGSSRDLFIYKVPVKEGINCPSFIGYTSISFPVLKDSCNRTIPLERSGLQFTPDGQSLVILNCIRSPCCREKNLSCVCSICELDCCEENAIKIVHVELGYTSTVAKLRTTGRICCILVCEPDHLLAVEGSGELCVWLMEPTWRVNLEKFILPSFHCSSPSVIELKQVPTCDYLIVGHNGAGGFCLWDISKRVLLSKFSTPVNTICQALPIGLFRFPKVDASATVVKMEDHVKEILAATDSWLFQTSKNDSSLSSTGEGTAVWLLVSATGLEAKNDHLMMGPKSSLGWRLALLAKDMVFLGSVLDPRASSLSALAGYGITGTSNGCVYIWELATGNKLVDLHCFKGESISSIVADAKSGAFAVASNKCQLRVYIQSWVPFHNS